MIRLLIFEEDGVPAGFANLMIIFSVWSHGKAMILDDLYVREDYRGKGFGGQALAYIEKYAAETGCRRLQFQAKRNNVRARGFYESKGYQPAEMCFYMKYL